jgi:hypothetical protein
MRIPACVSKHTEPVSRCGVILLAGLFMLAGPTSLCHANVFVMSATAQAVSDEPEMSYAANAEVGVAVQGTVSCMNPTSGTLTARLQWKAYAGLYTYPNGVSALFYAVSYNPGYPNATNETISAGRTFTTNVSAGPTYGSPANGQYAYQGWTTISDIKTGDEGDSNNVVIQPIQVGP